MVRFFALLAILLAGGVTPPARASPSTVAGSPRLAIDGAQRLILSAVPPVIEDDEVREHLSTGLTTSFYFQVRHGAARGGARIEIRYELWDEVYHVAAAGIDGAANRQTVGSFAGLVKWWRTLELPLLEGVDAAPRKLRLDLDVVPFSDAERDAAQRWLADSIERAPGRSGTDEVAAGQERSPDTFRRTLGILMSTSIRRRSVATYSWTVGPPAVAETSALAPTTPSPAPGDLPVGVPS